MQRDRWPGARGLRTGRATPPSGWMRREVRRSGGRAHHRHHLVPQQHIKVYARRNERDGILVGLTRLLE